MNMTMTMKEFLNNTGLDTSLVKATIRRLGGWENAKASFDKVSRCGANGDIKVFTCMEDNVRFYKRHRRQIVKMLEDYADHYDYQDDVISIVRHFNLFKDDMPTTSEVGNALYGVYNVSERVAEALAWYALERIADDFVFGGEVKC